MTFLTELRELMQKDKSCHEIDEYNVKEFLYDNADAIVELVGAAKMLHDETADYVTLNKLGDPHHNRSMQLTRDALSKLNGDHDG